MNATDLYAHAKLAASGGAASTPQELRAILVKTRDENPSPDAPSDDDISRIVTACLSQPAGLVDEPEPPKEQVKPRVRRAARDCSEAGIAEHIASGPLPKLLRFNTATAKWHAWNGVYWQETKDSIPVALQLEIKRQAADALKANTIDAKGVLRICSASGMRGIAGLLSAWPSAQIPMECDPPHILVHPTGVVDLEEGENLVPSSKRPVTRACPVSPASGSPLWPAIVSHLQVCAGEKFAAVHRYLGSALRGLGADRRVLWLWGPGGDGKSTLMKMLRAALGDYACTIPAEVIAGEARGAHGHELGAGLIGSRLAIATEVERADWTKLKSWSGGDEFVTKRLHGRRQTVERPPCLVIVGNHPPTPPDRASAERLIVVRMSPPVEQDERLMATLQTPGRDRDLLAGTCLSWLLDGCAAFQEHGLGPVPLFGAVSSPLETSWCDLVASGVVTPGKGWASLEDFRAQLPDALRDIHPREVAAFLRGKVQCKRFEDGRRYQMDVRLTHADAC